MARSNFYPNGHFVPYQLPQSYERSKTKQACGNCGLYSNRRSFCGKWRTDHVRDIYTCHEWGNDSLSDEIFGNIFYFIFRCSGL